MDEFDAVGAERATAAAPLRVGYCHGSEGGATRAIGALLVEQPEAAVRPDGLTSLTILDGLRSARSPSASCALPSVSPSGSRRCRSLESRSTTGRPR